jgi:hypothetical protein
MTAGQHPALRAVPTQNRTPRLRGVPNPPDDDLPGTATSVGMRDGRRADTPPLPWHKRYHRAAAGRDGCWTAACLGCGYTHLTEWNQVGVKLDGRTENGAPLWTAFFDCPYVPEFEIHILIAPETALRCVALGAHDVAAEEAAGRNGGGAA